MYIYYKNCVQILEYILQGYMIVIFVIALFYIIRITQNNIFHYVISSRMQYCIVQYMNKYLAFISNTNILIVP